MMAMASILAFSHKEFMPDNNGTEERTGNLKDALLDNWQSF